MAIDAAVLGIGVALESTLMMERELQRGMLIPAVADAPRIKLVTQWIVCPHSHLRQRKVMLFLEWMRKQRDEWRARRVV
jgi:DNA-binding transcriptional LysR family regulator